MRSIAVILVAILVGTATSFKTVKDASKREHGSVKRDFCDYDELQCADGSCYSANYKCDSWPDCPAAEDDLGCGECCNDEFMCDDGSCIPSSWICDNWDDCDNGEDEKCGSYEGSYCSSSQYQCANGECIPGSYQCDAWADCSGGEDDAGCVVCPCSHFACGDTSNLCVPLGWLCDGDDDCGDGTDERGCSNLDLAKRGKERTTKNESEKISKTAAQKRGKQQKTSSGLDKKGKIGKEGKQIAEKKLLQKLSEKFQRGKGRK